MNDSKSIVDRANARIADTINGLDDRLKAAQKQITKTMGAAVRTQGGDKDVDRSTESSD